MKIEEKKFSPPLTTYVKREKIAWDDGRRNGGEEVCVGNGKRRRELIEIGLASLTFPPLIFLPPPCTKSIKVSLSTIIPFLSLSPFEFAEVEFIRKNDSMMGI